MSLSSSLNSPNTSALSAFSQPKALETASPESIFPLPLAPIEQYLVMDDREECPMTSFIELHFASPLQADRLARALHQTVHHHPMLASRLITIEGRYHWQYDPGFVPTLRDPLTDPILTVPQGASPKSPAGDQPRPRPLDLTSEPGCRYWYQVDLATGKSRLTLQLHHAACDGVGLRRVLIDTLSTYAKFTDAANEGTDAEKDSTETNDRQSRRKRRDQLDVTRLLHRADFSEIKSKPPKESMGVWEKIRNAYYFHFQRPQPLQGGSSSQQPDQASGGTSAATPHAATPNTATINEPLRHYIFDEATSERLVRVCRENDIGVNDLALTVLFRVCRHWNRSQGIRSPKTRIRLLMPVDLRGRSDLQTPATNRLSFSFLGRTHGQCEDWEKLLTSVQTEIRRIKDTRVHMDFLEGLDALSPHPAILKRSIDWSRNMSTSVLTYTGDIARGMKNHFPEENGRRRIGDTFLENILIAPPAREHTNISMGMCINWGQICLSANWNRNEITSAQCQQFLQMYADAMVEWLTTMETEITS